MTSRDDIIKQQEQILQTVEGKTYGHLLRENATRFGSTPALSWRDGDIDSWQTLTWRAYRLRVAELTMGLMALGLGRGDYAAIMMVNRPEHLIADQAIVHAGATPTTFYATLASEQIEYVANHCQAKIAILENKGFMERWLAIRDKLPHLEKIVLLQDAEEYADRSDVVAYDDLVAQGRAAYEADRQPFELRWREVQPEDPVTLIYTSGTTGPPKGVILTHRNCLFESESILGLVSAPLGYTFVSYLPLAHIAERLLSIYLPMYRAAHIYLCPDPKKAIDFVKEARPTMFFGVPRVWEKVRAALIAKVEAEQGLKQKLPLWAIEVGKQVVACQQEGKPVPLGLRLKHALLEKAVLSKIRGALGLDRCMLAASAAAPLPVDVAEFFAALGLPLLEVYGMTETTGVATASSPDGIRIGKVGPALPGVEVKLGEDGEILVRGPNNTPGYLNRPEATAELVDKDGWVHTGDIGELDSDGYVKIIDRKKELIITAGGKNISPANIESLLKEHPLVGQALAFGDRKPYVAALIVLDNEIVPAWAEQHGISHQGLQELTSHPRIVAEIDGAVSAANARLARVEQVKRYRILPAEWTAESEELTPTMKLKRRVIHRKYAAEIEALYEQD